MFNRDKIHIPWENYLKLDLKGPLKAFNQILGLFKN